VQPTFYRLIRLTFVLLFFPFGHQLFAQKNQDQLAQKWADSVYASLDANQKIAQLMVTRLSTIDLKTNKVTSLFSQVSTLVKTYNIGGICIFQGSPVLQAKQINALQAMAQTPILISIDAEWGVGMRIIDSVLPLPKQMMLGAMKDASIVYRYGQVVAAQCKRMGIHMNYAPVMDVNNNPANPVINDRSFGENKYKVALLGNQYIKGLQEWGVMACVKHFPGHGDVDVDSHYDLPVINKSMAQLDSLELYPFREAFRENAASVMIGHLYIPAIDDRKNRPSSLSEKNITQLMRKQMNYEGLTITDGLEMLGVKKYFPDGASSVESIIAGNDLLCLPDNIPLVIEKMKDAIKEGRLSWADIEYHCKRVLKAKYKYVLPILKPIDTENLAADLNAEVPGLRKRIAENAITLLSRQDSSFFPLKTAEGRSKIAYVGIGGSNTFAARLKNDLGAALIFVDAQKLKTTDLALLADSIISRHQKIVIGVHQINRAPANNFGLSKETVAFVNLLLQRSRSTCFLFGNAYSASNFCAAKNLVVCYEDDGITQSVAADLLEGKLPYLGTLPVTVCEKYPSGSGLLSISDFTLPSGKAKGPHVDEGVASIDSIVEDAIKKKPSRGE
jgi:beta-glucosidase-like glycosyl hydrolase